MRNRRTAARHAEAGQAFIAEFRAGADPAALDRAVEAFERAVDLWQPPIVERADYLMWASAARRDRYRLTADPADLERSLAHGREAAEIAGDGDRPLRLANLVESLRLEYKATGAVEHLAEVVAHQAELVDKPVHDAYALETLPAHAQMLFRRTGRQEHLDLAVDIGRRSVAATTDPVQRARRHGNLALALRTRYESFAQREDLHEAVLASHEAVNGVPPGSADHLAAAANHVLVLQQVWQYSGDAQTLDEAVDAARAVVGLTPEDEPEHAARCSNLAAVLMDRYHRTGDPRDLAGSVDAARKAVRTTPPGDPHGWHYELALAIGLGERFEATGDGSALDSAVDLLTSVRRTLLATSPGEAGLFNVTLKLGQVTAHRSPDGGVALLREASRMAGATPAGRLGAAVQAAALAMVDGQAPVALAAYRDAIDLMPTVVWHGLTRESRERRLTGNALLGPDAAAAAIATAGTDPADALALLESGRSFLWTQVLHRRAVVRALGRVAPDVAARLEAIAGELGESAPATGTGP